MIPPENKKPDIPKTSKMECRNPRFILIKSVEEGVQHGREMSRGEGTKMCNLRLELCLARAVLEDSPRSAV